mmetsp:Transcript_5704/g.21560  ORF Transcript_5704/g.21560 Transcript_5704/m.21560 type:complete len:89 (+) Transcript_5704:1007-1273(+)
MPNISKTNSEKKILSGPISPPRERNVKLRDAKNVAQHQHGDQSKDVPSSVHMVDSGKHQDTLGNMNTVPVEMDTHGHYHSTPHQQQKK